jgi:mono/diheme cytochrome c family protein
MNAKIGLISVLVLAPACGDDDDGTTVADDPAAVIARGKYIVDVVAVCQDCHTPRDEAGAPIAEQYLAGAECFVRLENESCLNTKNLTNHETGLLNRTDEDIERMIRDGIRPAVTGDEALSPVMPYYVLHNMSEADLNAVVAYLRTVPGVDHAVPRSGPEFEVTAPANLLDPSRVPMPVEGYADREAALRGRYLAGEVGICLECHTRHIMGDPNVLDYDRIFAGGEEFPIGLPVTPISSNITSDTETGLGDWTVDEIVSALTQGTDKDGDGLCPPMPAGPMGPFVNLTAEDARDIAHYLESLPPINNPIDDMCTFPPM